MVTDKCIKYQTEKSGLKSQVFFYIRALVILHAIPPPKERQKPPKSQVLNLSKSLFFFYFGNRRRYQLSDRKIMCQNTSLFYVSALVMVHVIPPPIVRQKPPKSQALNLHEI